MKFDEAKQLLLEMNFDKWRKRYNPQAKYIVMGCEGRIMKRSFWKNNFMILLKLFDFKPKECSLENYLIEVNHDNNIPFANKKEDDWEVWDLYPGCKVKVEIGEKGLWG